MAPKKNRRRRRKLKNAHENMKCQPSTPDQCMEFTLLNDDCLRAIFANLTAIDLSAVKVLCDRFNYAADTVFEKNCLDKNANYLVLEKDGYEGNARIMEQFGHLITAIDFSFVNTDPNVQSKYLSLLKHCPTLHKLSADNVHFDYLPLVSIEIGAFKKLDQLVLNECKGTQANFQKILNVCDPLKLKRLYFLCSDRGKFSDDILAFIADKMVNVEDLLILFNTITKSCAENFTKMKNLKKLKYFDIKTPPELPIGSLINALTQNELLEKLSVMTATIMDENIANAINKLPKNVLSCKLWLDSKVPKKLMEKMTNFKCDSCAIGLYSSGRKFYVYEFKRTME